MRVIRTEIHVWRNGPDWEFHKKKEADQVCYKGAMHTLIGVTKHEPWPLVQKYLDMGHPVLIHP